jgi:LmbE family N-acetylglucosaminyl deacetylase
MHLIDFNEVVKAITRVIGIAKPDIVVTHWHGDLNKDHVILNEAVKVATRPKGDSIVPAVWEGFVSSSSDWGYTGAFDPRIFVTLTKEDLTAKLEAMACYGTECIGLRAPEALEAIARYTGAQVGTLYAEPFALVRSVL